MSSHHSQIPRGLDATRSPLYQGRFGRMFPDALPGVYSEDGDVKTSEANLEKLANAMIAEFDPPKDGPDGEESGIPALYTYFGQFLDHDITFDPVSLLTQFKDPDGLVDFRTPALDLDNVYGRGPADQPYLYEPDGRLFALGEELTGSSRAANDLPRFKLRALIGDPRNDENVIVSQLQGLFLQFHNRFAKDNDKLTFARVQKKVRFHYQYLVVNDFLPRIVSADVLDSLKIDGRYDTRAFKFYKWRNDPFMPVEFSVAAYRLGHSMIRPGYRLNDNDETLLPIFPPKGQLGGLTGFQPVAAGRALDWGRFIDIDRRDYGSDNGNDPKNKSRLQFAYKIDPSLVAPLGTLPPAVASNPDSLALRNLQRAFRLGLPTGQTVAKHFGVPVILDKNIKIGKATGVAAEEGKSIVEIDEVFTGNCPLWTYILAESALNKVEVEIPVKGGPGKVKTPQLGPVGGRIVAQVILGLLLGDKTSLLGTDPEWKPTVDGKPFADFKLRDFVLYALGDGPDLS